MPIVSQLYQTTNRYYLWIFKPIIAWYVSWSFTLYIQEVEVVENFWLASRVYWTHKHICTVVASHQCGASMYHWFTNAPPNNDFGGHYWRLGCASNQNISQHQTSSDMSLQCKTPQIWCHKDRKWCLRTMITQHQSATMVVCSYQIKALQKRNKSQAARQNCILPWEFKGTRDEGYRYIMPL